MLKYDLQLGCVVLPKSDDIDEMKQNLELDFTINSRDMDKLKRLEV